MKEVIVFILGVLVASWFLLIFAIIGISVYSVIFSMPAWVKSLVFKLPPRVLKKIFAIHVFGIAMVAILLSLLNHYDKK